MVQSFLGLCHRLYDFIMKCLATYAMKSVTLGHSSHRASAQEAPTEDASLGDRVEPDPAHDHSNVQEMGGDGSISSAPSNEEEAATQAQPPKKMVSINDTVEEMAAGRKKGRKKKRAEKVGSFDREIDEPKPLKSILKVGSKLDEESYI